MSFDIRPARTADAPAVEQLLADLGYPGTSPFLAQRMRQLLDHPDALLLVAERGDAVIGVLSAHFVPQLALAGDFCRISYLCIAPQERGAGVGAALEAAACEAARRRGCDRIELHSHARRVDAHRFYARLGYADSPKYLFKPAAAAPRPEPAGSAPSSE